MDNNSLERISWDSFIKNNKFDVWSLIKFNKSRLPNSGLWKAITFFYRRFKYKTIFDKYLNILKQKNFFYIADTDDAILYKMLRPFELSTYSIEERINVFKMHHNIISEIMCEQYIKEIYSEKGLEIAVFNPTENIPFLYRIVFHYSKTHRREGELTLSYVRENFDDYLNRNVMERIFSISFNFGYLDDKKVIKINSIQGCSPHLKDPQKEINNITKLSFGTMPKFMLMTILFSLLKTIEFDEILGIKKDYHVYSEKHYKNKFQNIFKTDYDKIWVEDFNGTEFNNNYYKLQENIRKPLDEIPSKKRSQYKKRYAFTDEVILNINRIFNK